MRDAAVTKPKKSDSESRVVALRSAPGMRSVQPTLAGIGPEELEEEEISSVVPSPLPFRSAEPTIVDSMPALPASFAPPMSHVPPPLPSAPVPAVIEAPPPSTETPPIPLVVRHVDEPLPLVVPAVSGVVAKPAAPAPQHSVLDPMDLLFDAGYELCFLQTAVEGATHCLHAARRAVGARGALVHLVDVHTGQFVTVAASEGAERQILSRHEDDDWLMSAAVFRGKPLRMEYGGEVSGRPMPRHAIWDGLANVLVVPVMGWGRALAVIELVDVSPAFAGDDRAENALAYLAERFSQFLGEREIVVGFDSVAAS